MSSKRHAPSTRKPTRPHAFPRDSGGSFGDASQFSNSGGGGGFGSSSYSNQGPAAIDTGCLMQYRPVFPQGVLSVAQGLVGTHRWYVSGKGGWQAIKKKLRLICRSHWPGYPDARPVFVQWGAVDEMVQVSGNVTDLNAALPTFDQYMIVAQYQLLHISDPWPTFGKPSHPDGTVLALQVRGGGEILQIDPTGLVAPAGKGISGCFTGKQLAPDKVFNSRIRIPLTEYHLICDRLTDAQLCAIMAKHPWREREGTVNSDLHVPSQQQFGFMAEAEGTLMFDTWTLDQTFVPDIDNPRRWRLSCVLKCRQIPEARGPYPENCQSAKYAVGWNHDYKRATDGTGDLAWRFIMMQDGNASSRLRRTPHGSCPRGFAPRYPYMSFKDIFCKGGGCLKAQRPNYRCGAAGMGSSVSSFSLSDMGGGGSFGAAIDSIVDDSRGVAKRKWLREQQLGVPEIEMDEQR